MCFSFYSPCVGISGSSGGSGAGSAYPCQSLSSLNALFVALELAAVTLVLRPAAFPAPAAGIGRDPEGHRCVMILPTPSQRLFTIAFWVYCFCRTGERGFQFSALCLVAAFIFT